MRALVISIALVLVGCAAGSMSHPRGADGGSRPMDAGVDAASEDSDADVGDAGAELGDASGDASMPDARMSDATMPDGGAVDAGACAAGLTRCGASCRDLRTDLASCGACGRVCDVAGGTEACLGGTCFVSVCEPGRGDCNATASDGCESTCASGSACTTSCGTAGALSCASVCAPTCTPPVESCNARDDDCDGSCESGLAGCRAGVHRSASAATGEHFYTLSREEAACCGFTVESFDYFFVYAASAPGLVPFHRCVLSTGFHFYTGSSTCEGSPGAIYESVIGWVGSAPTCGSTPLFRLWASRGGHFYTTDPAERDALAASGYVDEGIAAHVWRAR